ncbi:sensor histidine kinase [Streptomyces sp. NPDC059679]|uniref:sensor histidine kinase n=1 Tax=Streptomyces sp. NPDC059679 TaxID=3346903 RepID=UPI00368041EC
MLLWQAFLIPPAATAVQDRDWPAMAALSAYAALYSLTVRAAATNASAPAADRLLAALTVLTYLLASVYADNSLLLFNLLALAAGLLLRRRPLTVMLFTLAVSCVALALLHGSTVGDALSYSYGPLLAGFVTAAITSLYDMVDRLRKAREELARAAVERERLRFSRDLHDLLGHSMSVIVVKAEAVRRLAPRDLDAALAHAADIEVVGRQALAEIREAVTGYRQTSLPTELDRSRSVLMASGIEPVVRQSVPPLPPQTEALLGWAVREGVTNVVRHSRATRCEISLQGTGGIVRLEINDDGRGPAAAGQSVAGNGLMGLAERLAAARGSLTTGPGLQGRGFGLVAQLLVDESDLSAQS